MKLLCVGNYDSCTGYAWNTIRRVWAGVGARLEKHGVSTQVVEREPGGWQEWSDLVDLCREQGIDGCWLTDRELLSRDYGQLRAAGVRFIVNHERTSGARTAPQGPKRWAKKLLARRSSWTADRYVAISDFVRRRLLDVGCLPASKVVRIYNAIDTAPWSESVDREAVRRRLGIGDARPLVAMASRAQQYKGIGTLIDAVRELPADRKLLAVHCGDGPELAALRQYAAGEPRVQLLGRRDDYGEILRAADVAVVPPHWDEAFGLTVVEAMASGTPLVATAVGAIPELVEDRRHALLVPPSDAQALRDAILKQIDAADQARVMAKEAQARARSTFDFERLYDELEQLFVEGLL